MRIQKLKRWNDNEALRRFELHSRDPRHQIENKMFVFDTQSAKELYSIDGLQELYSIDYTFDMAFVSMLSSDLAEIEYKIINLLTGEIEFDVEVTDSIELSSCQLNFSSQSLICKSHAGPAMVKLMSFDQKKSIDYCL